METKQLKSIGAALLLAALAALGGCGSDNGAPATGNTSIFYSHSMIFNNHSTMAWGYNGFGQLGDGATTTHTDPRKVFFRPGVRGVALGGYHSVIFGTYSAWTAGGNNFGQLGRGSLDGGVTQDATFKRVIFDSYTTQIVAVASGGTHSLLADEKGRVWAWGGGGFGQLGNNGYLNSSLRVPVSIEASLTPLLQIGAVAAGGSHSLALNSSGVVYAWGNNDRGQLGLLPGTVPNLALATPVGGLPVITQIAAGGGFNLALDTNGNVWAWGNNSAGQLGQDKATVLFDPAPKKVQLGDVKQIAAGLAHAVVLKNDGTVWVWGFNGFGQLGVNNRDSTHVPAQPFNLDSAVPPNKTFLVGVDEVRALGSQSFARIGTKWYAWGDNSQGQLGYGTGAFPYSLVPGQIPGL